MKKVAVLFLVVISYLSFGCRATSPEATNTPAPTEQLATDVPVAEPTAQPEPTQTAADSGVGLEQPDALNENTWQWVSFTNPVDQFDVELPESYTLTFNDDGTVNIIADCNNATGSYTDEDGALTITIGPMTMAACPPDSHSDQFVTLLGSAARYFFDDAQLFIDLFADGGTMAFAPADAELMAAAAPTGSSLPPADITNEEGGPAVVTGEWSYSSFVISSHFPEPTVALMDVSRSIQRDFTEFVPRTAQIIGTLTSPMSPSPAKYRVDVPTIPAGTYIDLDNDGEQDEGIQIFALHVGPNIEGDSFLEQLEQFAYRSFLNDPQTGVVREGTFLVYAPDESQGFPSSAGVDGQYFTADDHIVGLPPGFTLVTLDPDGQVSFDRSRQVSMDTLETASISSPDFSDQGILESFNSLIDTLKVRYSFTELRNLDWEEIRQEYLPRVQQADTADDLPAYYVTLHDLALSIRDGHVFVKASATDQKEALLSRYYEQYGGNLGAKVVELSDGRFVITYLDPQGPGAQAGWQVGTEIISVDGVPMDKRIDSLPIVSSESTPEGTRLSQMTSALSFPPDTETTIEFQQPGESEVRSTTLTAGPDYIHTVPVAVPSEPISFKLLDGGYGYIQWRIFNNPLYKIAVMEEFLTTYGGAPGIVIDLRDNGGGNAQLLYTMASYLFTEKRPAMYHWLDTYTYDEQVNDLVLELPDDYRISAPKPELAYLGAVVVLVNESSASAAEFFPQFLQYHNRAIVVGEHGTEGAGGPVEQVKMPGSIEFYFTKGRFVFAGTDELNLEGKGVTLDVRIPITLENELAKQEGRDPVLEAALEVLAEEATKLRSARLTTNTWQWTSKIDSTGQQTQIDNPEDYTIAFSEDGALAIKADCNQVNGSYMRGEDGESITITLGPSTLAACPEGSRSDEFLELLSSVVIYQFQGDLLVLTVFSNSIPYVLTFEAVE